MGCVTGVTRIVTRGGPAKFYEVQKQVGLTEHTYTALPVMAGKKWWDGLKPEQRKVIEDSVRASVPEQRRTVAAQVDEGVKLLKAQGVTVNEVDKAKFVAATRDVPTLVADQVPPALVQQIRDTK